MAASKNSDRETRDRLRRYTARQSVNAHQTGRKRRDNIIAIVGVAVIVTLATVTQVGYFANGPGRAAPTPSSSTSPSPSASAAGKNTGPVPASTIAENRTWTGSMVINGVDLGISIDGARAPQASSVFLSLQKNGFYTGNTCGRLTTTEGLKVLQCGQPNTTTSVDPGFQFGPIENAPSDGTYPIGTIAMARATSTYSNSTQFFIVYGDTRLPTDGGGYTVFGKVTSGLEQLTSTVLASGVTAGGTDGAPKVPTVISSVTLK